ELTAYRIVQEAVTNVLRHAAARRLECTIVYRDNAVEVRVADDGSGTPSPVTGGHGLAGMRERAAIYGGSIEAGRGPAGGYVVHAVLPVPGAEPIPPAASPPEQAASAVAEGVA